MFQLQEKYGIDYQGHLQEMAKLREESRKHKQFSPAITAEKYRGQVGGLYVDRRETTNVNVELEKMSFTDLMQKLNEFVNKKSEKNVTPVAEPVESKAEEAPEINQSHTTSTPTAPEATGCSIARCYCNFRCFRCRSNATRDGF